MHLLIGGFTDDSLIPQICKILSINHENIVYFQINSRYTHHLDNQLYSKLLKSFPINNLS